MQKICRLQKLGVTRTLTCVCVRERNLINVISLSMREDVIKFFPVVILLSSYLQLSYVVLVLCVQFGNGWWGTP
jgi:hypothetical protein